MYKRITTICLALCMILELEVSAIGLPRYINEIEITAGMFLETYRVDCELSVISNNLNDDISAEIELYRVVNGNRIWVASWTDGGKGFLIMNEEYTTGTIISGTYRMEYSIVVDGIKGIDNVDQYIEKTI